ncbi:MAG: SLBB domain-containing protein [Clostridia bacterium]|nr:SLBB domain-containing protein [Clostridia bacterium]
MELHQLSEIMRNAGDVGAGGAGFPSYAKLNMAADTIILNCAECEPLLKLHRQVLSRYAREIMMTLQEIADTLQADSVIIAIKPTYTKAVAAVKAHLHEFSKIRISLLPEIYPVGDEIITIYETTGRVVAPGSLPITVGCVVYNVETIYNVYRAWKENAPVTHKYLTIAGEIKHPCTLRVPLGVTFGELIEMAGGETAPDTALICGGPMTGRIATKKDVVTKTTNAILVLPKDLAVIQKRISPISLEVKRAMAACCQCRMCTDLCSRGLLGHPIEPHRVMRAVAGGIATDGKAFLDTFACSSCGLCEMYACGQGLSPRSIIGEIKGLLRQNGVTPPKGVQPAPVHSARDERRVPMYRLISRLGLTRYDVDAPLLDVEIRTASAKVMLAQCIGTPATACVAVGDTVKQGQLIGTYQTEKLGTSVHAPFDGKIARITDRFIVIEAQS